MLGDGKTHYIKSQLDCVESSVTIAVNEAFSAVKAISKLHSLPLEKGKCGIFFNFTMLHPRVCLYVSVYLCLYTKHVINIAQSCML